MRYICDVVLATVFIITVIYHARTGLVDSILKSGTALLSAVCALTFGNSFALIFREYFFNEKLAECIYERILPMLSQVTERADLNSFLEQQQSAESDFSILISKLGISLNDLAASLDSIQYGMDEDIRTLARNISVPLTDILSKICGYLSAFLIATLTLIVIRTILNAWLSFSILKKANCFLGGMLGAMCGFIYVGVVYLILRGITEYGTISNSFLTLETAVRNSWICQMYANLIHRFIM